MLPGGVVAPSRWRPSKRCLPPGNAHRRKSYQGASNGSGLEVGDCGRWQTCPAGLAGIALLWFQTTMPAISLNAGS